MIQNIEHGVRYNPMQLMSEKKRQFKIQHNTIKKFTKKYGVESLSKIWKL